MSVTSRHSGTQMFAGLADHQMSGSPARVPPGGASTATAVFQDDLAMIRRAERTAAQAGPPRMTRIQNGPISAVFGDQEQRQQPHQRHHRAPRAGHGNVFQDDVAMLAHGRYDTGSRSKKGPSGDLPPWVDGGEVEKASAAGVPQRRVRSGPATGRGGSAGVAGALIRLAPSPAAAPSPARSPVGGAPGISTAGAEDAREVFYRERAERRQIYELKKQREAAAPISSDIDNSEGLAGLIARAAVSDEGAVNARKPFGANGVGRDTATPAGRKKPAPPQAKGRGAPRCAQAVVKPAGTVSKEPRPERGSAKSKSKSKKKTSRTSRSNTSALSDAREVASARHRKAAVARRARDETKAAGSPGVGFNRNKINRRVHTSSRVMAPPGGKSSFSFY